MVGSIEIPMAVGLVGGAVRIHPGAQANVALLGLRTADDLAKVMAAAGLAQNRGALRALATVGIQAGHMKLHRHLVAKRCNEGFISSSVFSNTISVTGTSEALPDPP